jgi:hypothetical protein
MGCGRLARLRRLRAEALAERLEAPAGLWRRVLGARASPPACGDCGLKPSLSAWKPRRGYGVESWVRGRLARMPGAWERGRLARMPGAWVRGRLARVRRLRADGD